MLMLTMGMFNAYKINDILNMPYSHFRALFSLAEKLNLLYAQQIQIGRGLSYDNDAAMSVSMALCRTKSKKAYKQVATANAKNKVVEMAKGVK